MFGLSRLAVFIQYGLPAATLDFQSSQSTMFSFYLRYRIVYKQHISHNDKTCSKLSF